MEESDMKEYMDFIQPHLQLDDGIEQEIIKGTLEGKTYKKIIAARHLSGRNKIGISTLRDRGSKLWRRLRDKFGHDIKKTNFLETIGQICKEHPDKKYLHPVDYVKRKYIGKTKSIEEEICDYLNNKNDQKQSLLVRIKASQKMGKTWLLQYILRDANKQGLKTVVCDFNSFPNSTYGDFHLLLKTFCSEIMDKLNLNSERAEQLSHNNIINKAGRLIENHILNNFTEDLVLVLENFDQVLKKEDIREDFLKFLLMCHNESSLKRLRLIVIHSTDVYGREGINHSPFWGKGQGYSLKMFDELQIKELLEIHNLKLTDAQRNQVIELLGGHPFLSTLAINELKETDQSFEDFINKASTEQGIFRDYLQELLNILNENSDLREAYGKVVNSDEKEKLSRPLSFRLYSLGLIKREGDYVVPSCNLYKDYFKECLQEN